MVINDTLSVNIVTDRRTPARGKFTLTAMTLDGKTVMSKTFDFTAKPLTSTKVFSAGVAGLLDGRKKGDVIFHTTFETGGRTYENVGFSTKQKFMNYTAPDYQIEVAAAGDGYDVTVGSDVFARGVFLSLDGIDNFFSDNYFNVMPGGKRTIHVTTPLGEKDFRNQLKVISMGDIHARTEAGAAKGMKRDANFKPLGAN